MIVTIEGKEYSFAAGLTFEEIRDKLGLKLKHDIVLCIVNGKLQELSKVCLNDCTVRFVTTDEKSGFFTYQRSATFLMLKVANDICGKFGINMIKVEHTNSNGMVCSAIPDNGLNEEFIKELKKRMSELVSKNLKIEKSSVGVDEAVSLFKDRKMFDKVNLLKYRRASKVNIYELEGYVDYSYGYLVPSTGYIKYFDLELFEDSFILVLPMMNEPDKIRKFNPYRKLFRVQNETNDWCNLVGIGTAGELNDCVTHNRMRNIILVQEALQEKKIGEIAEDIYRTGKHIVLIAGPSSSGKTTFSYRLSIQLATLGLTPHPIAVDNYFRNRDDIIPGPDNKLDFEALDVVDVEQFNDDMNALLRGEKVEIPEYNFITGKREYKGNFEHLGNKDILVVEGIHCMNEAMSYRLPKENKYKVYISALTVLNLDDHNRIPTTDARLIRRMVRDARTRGVSAVETLDRWASVRRGEDNNIFPYQEEADAMFNSVLIYELSVLKNQAEALLFGVPTDCPEFLEAKRMLKFLDFFVGIDSTNVPKNSIIREFIGGGSFNL